MSRLWNRLGAPLAVGASSGVVMALRLFVPRPIGMADNGDGPGLMCQLHLAPRQQGYSALYDAHVIFRYYHSNAPCSPYARSQSSTIWLMRTDAWVARVLHLGPALDLRVSMVLYCLVIAALTTALCLAVPWGWKGQALTAAGLFLVAADSSVAGYPGSPFTETVGIIGLLVMAVAVLWAARTDAGVASALVGLAVFAGAAALTMTSKVEAATTAVPVVVFLAWLAFRRRPAWISSDVSRRTASAFLATVSLVVIMGVTALATITLRDNPSTFASVYRTEAVFAGILPHTSDPAQALKDLGLPESMARYSGRTWWSHNPPEYDPAFPRAEAKLSYATDARYLLTHPLVAVSVLDTGAEKFLKAQPTYLGSFQLGQGPSGVQEHRLALLSTLMSDVSPLGLAAYLALTLGAGALAVRLLRRRRPGSLGHAAAAASLLFNAIAAVQLFTSTFADVPDVKHDVLGVLAGMLSGGFVALAAASIKDRPGAEPAAAVTQELVLPPEERPTELVGAESR